MSFEEPEKPATTYEPPKRNNPDVKFIEPNEEEAPAPKAPYTPNSPHTQGSTNTNNKATIGDVINKFLEATILAPFGPDQQSPLLGPTKNSRKRR